MAKKNHRQEYAIIGLGRFGMSLALRLEELGHTVMAIDEDPVLVQSVADNVTHAAALDATNEEALRVADVASFDTVVVAIGANFEANLLTTASLKNLGVKRVICKTQTNRQRNILLRIGADQVIQPEQNSAERLAQEMSVPAMLERIPLGPGYSLAEVVLPKSLANLTLAQCNLRQQYDVTVLLVKRGDELIMAPPADIIFQPDDILVVLGADVNVTKFSKLV
jgi:trk system potassium uptake protein TrkA